MTNKIKSRILQVFQDFIRLSLVAVALLLILRLAQFRYLSGVHILPPYALKLEWMGVLQDIVLWQFVSWIVIIPFTMLSFIKRWIGIVFYILVFLFLVFSEWALFQYFSLTIRPLDQVIFSYSYREVMMITGSCVKFNLITFLPFILIFLATLVLLFFFLRLRLSKYFLSAGILLSLGSLFFIKLVTPEERQYKNPFEYYIVLNKSDYFFHKCAAYLFNSKKTTDQYNLKAASERYHAAHPGFTFLGNKYPFLHDENAEDVLSGFFNLKKEKPNLVFIIVESLSSCFMGNNPVFGSYTPFLDSLAGKSLFWNNFLSTADRTFNVLPAVFASLPPGDPTFVNDVAKIPYHLSMIRYLREGGYYTSFFYGGDPSFNYMKDFLQRQETDFILHSFGPKYKRSVLNEGYSWGYSDTDLFERAIEALDSLKKSPRLDIYLTLSLHSPFIPPEPEYYAAQMDERIRKISPDFPLKTDIEKYKNIFATILYTDHALKVFMDDYRKRPEFSNTIFIITGDHALPELNLFRFSGLEHYHVPLIIYSPLLKQPVYFPSVSSHLDITPSFLAMLSRQYGIKTQSVSTWLGSGIDTSTTFRNTHILPFILNSKEIVEYVNQQYYLDQSGIQRIMPQLELRATEDPVTRKRMQAELEDFKLLNSYITRQNKLIPPELLFQKVIDSVEIPVKDSVFFSAWDSTGEFRSIFHDIQADSKFRLLRMELTFDFFTAEKDFQKIPVVVLDIFRKGGKHVIWQYFEFPFNDDNRSDQAKWRTVKITGQVDLSYLKEKEPYSLMSYIWNKAHCTIKFNNPRVKIYGFY